MTNNAFKIEDGQREYDNYINALKIAKAKAEDTQTPVKVYKKHLNKFVPVLQVHPDGKEEKIDS